MESMIRIVVMHGADRICPVRIIIGSAPVVIVVTRPPRCHPQLMQ
jgi:hypothetical protein